MRQITYLSMILALLMGATACCQVDKPKVSPTEISIEPQSLTLHVGDKQALKVSYTPADASFPISYTSQNPDVASVSEKGIVEALKEGKTVILVQVGELKKECPVSVVSKDTPVETILTVIDTQLPLRPGQKEQIKYTVTPEGTPVTFAVDNPDVARVSDTGEVTALLMGRATVTLQAEDKTGQCVVTVKDEPENVPQQMPLLKFEAKYNKELHITDAEVLAHEQALGRVETEIQFTNHQRFLGFANTKLHTITGVLYGLRAKGIADIIVAYSKESLETCDRTKAMLNQLGFTKFKEIMVEVNNRHEPGLEAVNDKDIDLSVRLYSDPNPPLESDLYIQFSKTIPPAPIQTKHEILTDAVDFPSLEKFATLDATQIKDFESTLGLRTYDEERSAGNTLYFNTTEAKIPQTNIEYVCYMGDPLFPPTFISCRLLSVSNQKDVESEAMKSYLKSNGYDQRYEIKPDKELHVYNAQGDQCIVAIRTYGEDPVCTMTLTAAQDLQKKNKVSSSKKVVRPERLTAF